MVTSKTILGWMRGVALGALLTLSVATTPSAASRPRVAKFGVYYAKSYSAYMADCARAFALAPGSFPVGGEPLIAHVEIIGDRPKVTKLPNPKGDVDNYAKGALDAATKATLWSDDSRVECLIVTKRWSEPGEEPGVVLTVGEIAPAI